MNTIDSESVKYATRSSRSVSKRGEFLPTFGVQTKIMKRNMNVAIWILIVGFSNLLAHAQTPDKQAAKAREAIQEGKRDLRKASIDSAADYTKFKMQADMKIKENQASISKLKVRRNNDLKSMQLKYDEEVHALEQKNVALEKKIKAACNSVGTVI